HPEIEQRDAVIVCEKHVAGMGIGMEKAVEDDLMKVCTNELASKLFSVDVKTGDRTEPGDLRAQNKIHRQHARCRVVIDRLRDDKRFENRKIMAEHPKISGFVEVIQQD